jgi:predicted nucleotidyltransferase
VGVDRWVESNLVLKVLGGSRAYGTHTATSDTDHRGVALPPVRWLVGFPPGDGSSLTSEHKTAANDTVVHALEKFCRLALRANPNMLEVLFCRDAEVVHLTETGAELRAMRHAFLSRQAYDSFSGYALGQLRRMGNHHTRHGAHGQLIEQHGYDTKNAMHLIRLLRMAAELLRDGELHVYRSDSDFLLGIRAGWYSATQVQAMAEDLDAQCLAARDSSPLPEHPERERVEHWLMGVQTRWVNGDRSLLREFEPSGGS